MSNKKIFWGASVSVSTLLFFAMPHSVSSQPLPGLDPANLQGPPAPPVNLPAHPPANLQAPPLVEDVESMRESPSLSPNSQSTPPDEILPEPEPEGGDQSPPEGVQGSQEFIVQGSQPSDGESMEIEEEEGQLAAQSTENTRSQIRLPSPTAPTNTDTDTDTVIRRKDPKRICATGPVRNCQEELSYEGDGAYHPSVCVHP